MKRLVVFVLVHIFLLTGCGDNHSGGIIEDLPLINLEYSSLETVSLDSIVTNVRFVKLETNEDCLIEKYDEIQIFGDKIFVISKSGIQEAIFIFDLDGEFLGKIDALGRGPGEYSNLMSYYVNTEDEYVGVIDFTSELNVYDFNGKFLFSRKFESFDVGDNVYWFNNYHYFTIDEMTPYYEESEKLSEFDAVRIYDSNFKPYKQGFSVKRALFAPYVSSRRIRLFVANEDELFYIHRFGDLIYRIDKGQFEPIYMLDYGKHKVPNLEETVQRMNKDLHNATVDYLIPNELHHPGEVWLAVTNDYIWTATTIGRRIQNIIYSIKHGGSIRTQDHTSVDARNLTNIRPENIINYRNGFLGYISAEEVRFLYEYGNYHNQHSHDGILSPVNVPGIDSLNPQDNAILVFFEIRSDVFDRFK